MATTTNLNITEVVPSQNNKEITINNAFEALDQATQGALSITVTAAFTLTEFQFRSRFAIELVGTPAAAFVMTLPASIARFFAVINRSGQSCTVRLGAETVVVANDAEVLIWTDGAVLYSWTAS